MTDSNEGAPTTAPLDAPPAQGDDTPQAPSGPREARLDYARALYAHTCGAKGCREPYFGFVRPSDPELQAAYVCGPHPETVIHAVRAAAARVDWNCITGVFHVRTGAMLYPPEA